MKFSEALSIQRRKANLNRARTAKHIPDKWEDFAKLCDIRSGSRYIKFHPYEYQIDLIETIINHPTTVITKTRQLGATEAISNYFLYKACKEPGFLGVIFSRTQSDTSNIASRLRMQVKSIGHLVVPTSDNLMKLELSSGGRIMFRNSTVDGPRGLESVSHILFDEAAFVDDIEDLYGAALPTTTVCGDDARIIILSTPNGQSGWYYDRLVSDNGDRDLLQECEKIRKGESAPYQSWTDDAGNGKFLLHWLAHPIFSKKENYLESLKSKFLISDSKLKQEYDLSFIEADEVVFPFNLVREALDKNCQSSEVNPIGRYFMGVDVSMMGDDYTVAVILEEIDKTFYLRELSRKRKQTQEANLFDLSRIIEKWQPLSLGIEINSAGQLYYESLSKAYGLLEIKPIKTTALSKPVLIQQLLSLLEGGRLILPDSKFVTDEFLSFRRKGDKLEATSGKHDDIIMAIAFAVDAFTRK